MFGMPAVPFFNPGDNGAKGDQVRGFGFLHDGSVDTVFRFHNAAGFNANGLNPAGFAPGAAGDLQRRNVEAFMLSFDSNLAPIVGQQATLTQAGEGSDRRVAAKSLVIRDNTLDDEERRVIRVRSADASIAVPLPGSDDDPRCGSDPPGTVKATLTVTSRSTLQTQTADLRCDNWTPIGPPAAPLGYRYRDPELDDSVVRSLVWKNGRVLRALLKGSGPTSLTYDLRADTDEGHVLVDLKSGQAHVCLQCGAANGNNGSDAKLFKGTASTCAAPTSCLVGSVGARLDLLVARAETLPPECDLVVKGTLAGEARGWRYRPTTHDFDSDRLAEAPLGGPQLRAAGLVAGQELTFTCVPPGSGQRIGLDRDDDGFRDRDEIDGGSDPADPLSTP
jgi:hypothetical protein